MKIEVLNLMIPHEVDQDPLTYLVAELGTGPLYVRSLDDMEVWVGSTAPLSDSRARAIAVDDGLGDDDPSE